MRKAFFFIDANEFQSVVKAHYKKKNIANPTSIYGVFPQTLTSVPLNHTNSLNQQAMNV